MPTLLEKLAVNMEAGLTAEQRRVVTASGRMVVIACPGSGKTRTVAFRVARLILERRDERSGIAALSFTNNAVHEIVGQLEALGIGYPLPTPHFVGTIDSFLVQHLFKPYGHLVMGCDTSPQIVSPDQISILDGFLPQKEATIWRGRKVKPLIVRLGTLEFLRDGSIDLSRLLAEVPPGARKRSLLDTVRAAKLAYARAGLATHSDVVFWCYRLMTEPKHRRIADALRQKYEHWILDEAQDTSELHERILNALWQSAHAGSTLVIGDPDQSIFEWNQARPDFLLRLAGPNRDGWSRLPLTVNWRSSQLICNATHSFRNPRLFDKPSTAKGPDAHCNVRPILLTFPLDQCWSLPRALKVIWERKLGRAPFQRLTVVTWTNDMVGRICGRDSGQIQATAIVRQLAESAICYRRGEITPAFQILERTICQFLFERPDPGGDYEWLPSNVAPQTWRTCLSRLLVEFAQQFDEDVTVNAFVNSVRNAIGRASTELGVAPPAGIGNKVRVTSTSAGEAALSAYTGRGDDLREVSVTTIHKVKGSSVDALMLVSDYDPASGRSHAAYWLKPPDPATGLCEEPRRLGYVAMTRPRKLLVVAVPQECGNTLLHHRDWELGNFEYMAIDQVVSP